MRFIMQSEKQFSAWLMDKLKGHAQRIETTTGNGVPDINLCHKGREFWIETKIGPSHRTLLRKEQYAWGTRRALNGGVVLIYSFDPITDLIAIWSFPVSIVKCGKYLKITTPPDAQHSKSAYIKSIIT